MQLLSQTKVANTYIESGRERNQWNRNISDEKKKAIKFQADRFTVGKAILVPRARS